MATSDAQESGSKRKTGGRPPGEMQSMDFGQFDALAMSVASGGGSRRAVLRLLAVGTLAGLVARLGLGDNAAAKPKKHKAKHGQQRRSQQERNRQGQLQAEGKRNGKKKHKRREREEKPDEECGSLPPNYCGTCEKALCVAGDWICASSGEKDCGGGVCVQENECCPGQKTCPGYTECFAADECCPDALPPLCEPCEEVVCDGGGLVCRPKPAPVCSSCQQLTCETEKWVCTDKPHENCPYPNWVWDANLCRCVCAEDYVDCGVHWVPFPPPFGSYRGKCSCHLDDGRNYCDEDKGICCSLEHGCDI